MQSIRFAISWITRTAVAILIGLLAAPTAWAAAAEPPPTGQDYVKSYMLSILVCALGIMVVCRPAHRTTEIQFDAED